MKKSVPHRSLLVLLLISLFLLTEAVWIIHLYRIEKNDFHHQVNHSIQLAIREEAHRIMKAEPSYHADFRPGERFKMEYTVRGRHFKTDTLKKVLLTHLDRMSYDFHKEYWNLESVINHFQHLSPLKELAVIFVRQDPEGQVIEQFPAHKVAEGLPAFPPEQLGNTEKDQLLAWYDFPLIKFWEDQKAGLLISLLPFVLALYHGILIIRKERTERENLRFMEKQTIFIHDLKTPLCTNRDIENRVLKNLDNWPPEKIQEKLKISRQQAEQLVNEMQKVTLQSAERWGGEIENQTFNLKKALEELIHNRQCGNENSQITLKFQLANPEIFADPFHLVHMVDNLLSNALKHAGEAANIQISCSSNKYYQLIISVKDNGPGIPKQIRKYIFRPGFHKNSRDAESHGIGLTYIRRITRQYGGYIRIESRKNEGSEFILALNPTHRIKKTTLSTPVYHYFLTALLLAEIVGVFVLYHAERNSFADSEKPLIEKALSLTNKNRVNWQDTACFRNNWQEKTITITRGRKDTTLPMGTTVNQNDIYRRLIYDLRDSRWCLDSIGSYYQTAKNLPPLFLKRTDNNNKVIDHYPSGKTGLFMPVVFHLPLGYVEGHQLEVQLAYPWTQPLADHKGWLLLALIATLLSGWFTYLLLLLTRRQQALIHFQREKLQHFIRELQTQLQHVLYVEIDIPLCTESRKARLHLQLLHGNIKQYENMLGKINYLLDQLVMIRTHRLIFE